MFSGKKEKIRPKWVKLKSFAVLHPGITDQSKMNAINLWRSGLVG